MEAIEVLAVLLFLVMAIVIFPLARGLRGLGHAGMFGIVALIALSIYKTGRMVRSVNIRLWWQLRFQKELGPMPEGILDLMYIPPMVDCSIYPLGIVPLAVGAIGWLRQLPWVLIAALLYVGFGRAAREWRWKRREGAAEGLSSRLATEADEIHALYYRYWRAAHRSHIVREFAESNAKFMKQRAFCHKSAAIPVLPQAPAREFAAMCDEVIAELKLVIRNDRSSHRLRRDCGRMLVAVRGHVRMVLTESLSKAELEAFADVLGET